MNGQANKSLLKIISRGRQVERHWEDSLMRQKYWMKFASEVNQFFQLSTEQEIKGRRLWKQLGAQEKNNDPVPFLIFLTYMERLVPSALKDDAIQVTTKDRPENQKQSQLPLYLLLENIRSAFNIGLIFRSAECLGVQKIYLTGYTSTPEHPTVVKTSMGCTDYQTWEYCVSADMAIQKFYADVGEKGKVYALETAKNAVDIYGHQFHDSATLMILGNERYGVSVNLLEKCDKILSIPVRGVKNSLNVATAGAVAIHEFYRQLIY